MPNLDRVDEPIEISANATIYFDGVDPVDVDGMLHLLFWVRQPKAGALREVERVVVARMVMRTVAYGGDRTPIAAALELAAAMARSGNGGVTHRS